jgi:hypothetical protein
MQQPPKKIQAGSDFAFSDEEAALLLTPEALEQAGLAARRKGELPSQMRLRSQASLAVAAEIADITDAIRWQANKQAELTGLKTQDTHGEKQWVDELVEDLITYGIGPGMNPDEIKTILKELDQELDVKAEAGYGPEARNYIVTLKRQLEMFLG